MLRKVFKTLAISAGLAVLVVGGLVVRGKWLLDRSYADLPAPPIQADHSAAARARGDVLFNSLCIACHGGPDGRATGKQLDDVPEFFGRFYSANLAHPTHGVRSRSDAELARVLRHGVLPDGRVSVVMKMFGSLGDADVAALIGYMHSDAAAFAPAGSDQPRSQPSLVAALIVATVAKLDVGSAPPRVVVPEKSASVEYGRYMAQAMDCVGCHTDSFATDKIHEPNAFAGGMELRDESGAAIYTRNITPDDASGIGRWSFDDFERAVVGGVRPDGYLLRKPMPHFARLDRTDLAAIYAFLRTVPKVNQPNKAGGRAPEKATAADAPEVLFGKLGCVACHGEHGPYRDKIVGALGKSDAEVATWILDPQAIKPGTAMPAFERAIDRAQAERLARFVKQMAQARAAAVPAG